MEYILRGTGSARPTWRREQAVETHLPLGRSLGGLSGDHAHIVLSVSGKATTLALISPGADDDVLGQDGWSAIADAILYSGTQNLNMTSSAEP